jgi:hypothetical protein
MHSPTEPPAWLAASSSDRRPFSGAGDWGLILVALFAALVFVIADAGSTDGQRRNREARNHVAADGRLATPPR